MLPVFHILVGYQTDEVGGEVKGKACANGEKFFFSNIS